jgi:glycine cleavage system H protein
MNVKQNENKTFQIVPQNSNKCVWMEAGIVSYKICDRNLECESCPLDLGLRGKKDIHQKFPDIEIQQTGESDIPQQRRTSRQDSSLDRFIKLNQDKKRYVYPGHSWIEVLNQNQVKIGIDDIVATALGAIDEVILPLPGEKIIRGTSCGQVIQFEHIFSIVSPVSGQVIKINKELAAFPNELTLDPLNKGWMMIIKPDNLEQDLKYCRTGDALVFWYLKEFKWFESNLSRSFHQDNQNIGITLTDGGEISRNLRNHLPTDQYRRLILNLLGLPDSDKK